MKLWAGRIPLSDSEFKTVKTFLSGYHGPGPVSLTRRDANESGPVIVQVGNRIHVVTDGKVTEVSSG